MIMIKFEYTEVVGWEAAIRGMRNPMNSWEKEDSNYCYFCDDVVVGDCENCQLYTDDGTVGNKCDALGNILAFIGPNDHELMMSLAKGGPVHAKYRRMITVYVDITAPLYWWKEFDTYKVGTVTNSCSTMHKIHEKEFILEDFSCEHLIDDSWDRTWITSAKVDEDDASPHKVFSTPLDILKYTIEMLNIYRTEYLEVSEQLAYDMPHDKMMEFLSLKKKYWWQMIQLLPSSYNQRRTVMLNYEVLAGIYPMRKNHKLDEWHDFCRWIESLPYSEIITCEVGNVRDRNGEKSNE